MVAVRINLSKIVAIQDKLKKISDPEYLLRQVCFDLVDLMKRRIHIDGEDSTGAAIGEYGKDYLSYRQRAWQRTDDKKIVVSLTRQLENDWAVLPTGKGYAIGFNNAFNYQKARWVEENKGKIIFSLSPEEKKYAEDTIHKLINDVLSA